MTPTDGVSLDFLSLRVRGYYSTRHLGRKSFVHNPVRDFYKYKGPMQGLCLQTRTGLFYIVDWVGADIDEPSFDR
jgi:hypothetical protein